MITLCPYTMEPAAALREASDEHIIPYALGGSDQFTLRADRGTNSKFGDSVDSGLIHAGLVRMFAAQLGVMARPKRGEPAAPVRFRTKGVEQNTGRIVKVEFGHHSLTAEYSQPVDVDPLTKEIRGIYGMGEQTFRVMADVKRGLGRKGKTFEAGPVQTIAQPQIKGNFDTDLFPVWRGLSKIAYLVTARTLGDAFVLSAPAGHYRKAMWSGDKAQFLASGLEHYPYESFAFLPETTVSQHLVACYRIDDIVVTVVRLFGQPLLSLVCVIPSDGFELAPLEGSVVVNDSQRRTIVERTLLQAARF